MYRIFPFLLHPTTSAHMQRLEVPEVWKPFLRKMSIELGVDPDYEDPSGLYPPLVQEIWSLPEVVAIWGPRRRASPRATDAATADAVQDAVAASTGDEVTVATTSREAGPKATNADEHSAAAERVVGMARAARSSPIMPNHPRSPRPTRPTPMGSFDALSTPRPVARLPQAVPRGVQTPMATPNPTASPQQARALTTDSPPASAARLADNKQESSAPAAPKPNHVNNDESPALTRKRKALHDLADGRLRATCRKKRPSPPGAPPAPASPAVLSDRPSSPASSGPWSPPPFPGTRTGRPVDPDQDVEPLELPPAVYSVPFTAPQRILVDSFAEYPDKLPLTLPLDQDDLAVLRDVNPGGPEENAEAGNVADDEDEPGEYAL